MTHSAALPPGETFDPERLYEPREAVAAYFAAVTLPTPAVEMVGLEAAFGRILARDAVADAKYPADPRSTMDGFAIVAGDGTAVRRIVGEVRMGQAPPGAVGPVEAMRIPTGGVVPDGADAVIPVEDVDEIAFTGESGPAIAPREAVARGENVTAAGEDMLPGDVVLTSGLRIGGPELGVLATLGITSVPVWRKPRVAIISTGDELVDASEKPGRGQVRDSNRWAIAGALLALGCTPVQRPVAGDTFEALEAALGEALAAAEAVVLTGGSSVGVRDLTPQVIEALAAATSPPSPGVIVHGLKIKPGKPTVFAMIDGKPVIGLPGNPASSLMVLEAIVAPVFSALAGETVVPAAAVTAVTADRFSGRPGWTWYIPVELRREAGHVVAGPLSLRSAHTSLLARAHGYLTVGPDPASVPAGETVAVRRFLGGGRAL
jgi:molybdopterin molybdotransferase